MINFNNEDRIKIDSEEEYTLIMQWLTDNNYTYVNGPPGSHPYKKDGRTMSYVRIYIKEFFDGKTVIRHNYSSPNIICEFTVDNIISYRLNKARKIIYGI